MKIINSPLQNILCGRKLVFGDAAQIAEYKRLNREAREGEERERKREARELKTYRVHLEVEGSYFVDVKAVDERDAKNVALEEEIDYNDIEVTVYCVDHIENKKRAKG